MVELLVISDYALILEYKMQATFECLLKTYGFLTPDFWKETRFTRSPFQEYTDLLGKSAKTLVLEDAERVDL